MARAQSRFVCQACGAEFLRWEGQCRACDAWNTLVETVIQPSHARRAPSAGAVARGSTAVPLAAASEPAVPRQSTGLPELDRVLGGGLVPGSLVLLGGEPGIGKSTLLLQVAGGVASSGGSVLYATGEESAAQVRLRAERLGLLRKPAADPIALLPTSEVGAVVELARASRPRLVVVDSIQTMTVDELDGPAGSVGQVRESALRLMDLAKAEGITVVLVGHVTKDGTIAGPRTLEHLVDAVLEFGGDRTASLRLVRAAKNRFGSTDEVGVFEMREAGLVEIPDPGRAFLGDQPDGAPGSVVAATIEGSRPLLVQVQALVSASGYATPTRRVTGLDPNRLSLLLAVLARRAGIGLGSHDVYANLVGGLAIAEPGLDLAVALAIASAFRDRSVVPGTVAIGEVGLLGELRGVRSLDRRLREAVRLGFSRAIVPDAAARSGGDWARDAGLELRAVATLREAIAVAIGGSGTARPARTRAAAGGARDRTRVLG
jgi:DNA repair protein RadA/Sms